MPVFNINFKDSILNHILIKESLYNAIFLTILLYISNYLNHKFEDIDSKHKYLIHFILVLILVFVITFIFNYLVGWKH